MISFQEFTKFMSNFGWTSSGFYNDLKEMFKNLDVDGDGKINFTEYVKTRLSDIESNKKMEEEYNARLKEEKEVEKETKLDKLETKTMKNVENKNLLENPCGDLDFNRWLSTNILPSDDKDDLKDKIASELQEYEKNLAADPEYTDFVDLDIMGYKIENNPVNCQEILNASGSIAQCFATSYSLGKKLQIIKLNEEHIGSIMPKVEIEEFYTSRRDCGSEYYLNVYVINSKFEIIDTFNFNETMPKSGEGEWKNVNHTFDFKEKFQYIIFYHAGKDTSYWDGYYGSKMTNGSVKLITENKTNKEFDK